MPANVAEILAAYDAGQSHYRSWRKVPTQTTASGIWFDLSMSPGNPVPQYYAAAPLAAIRMARSTDGGLDHGPAQSGYTKHLHKFLTITPTATAAPLPMILCDYLLYYPFIGMDAGEQSMTNDVALSRYTDGAGVKVMAVEVASQVGGARFFITYTNSAGVTDRISPTVTCNTQTVNGTIITSAPVTAGTAGPFLPLADGDTGVRSIEKIEFLAGDVGLISLVLVKPLASHSIYDITGPSETDFLINKGVLPVIEDDAYLNMIVHPVGTLAAAPIIGEIQTFWS